jgi:hypothetical protein
MVLPTLSPSELPFLQQYDISLGNGIPTFRGHVFSSFSGSKCVSYNESFSRHIPDKRNP